MLDQLLYNSAELHTRWARSTCWASKLISRNMQNIDLQNYADSQTRWASNSRWTNFLVRNFQT